MKCLLLRFHVREKYIKSSHFQLRLCSSNAARSLSSISYEFARFNYYIKYCVRRMPRDCEQSALSPEFFCKTFFSIVFPYSWAQKDGFIMSMAANRFALYFRHQFWMRYISNDEFGVNVAHIIIITPTKKERQRKRKNNELATWFVYIQYKYIECHNNQ